MFIQIVVISKPFIFNFGVTLVFYLYYFLLLFWFITVPTKPVVLLLSGRFYRYTLGISECTIECSVFLETSTLFFNLQNYTLLIEPKKSTRVILVFQGISFLSPLSHSLLLPYCLRFRPDYMSVLSSLRPSTIFDRFRFSKKGDLEDLSSVETVVELIGGFWVKLTTVSLKILLYKHKKYGDLNTIKQCYHHP